MARHRILSFVLLACQLVLAAALLYGQPREQDPLVYRASRLKMITGEVRLQNATATIQLSAADKFKDARSYWVGATVVDSTTGTGADSIRAFAIKNLAGNKFTIRSVQRGDTCKIRWAAFGR